MFDYGSKMGCGVETALLFLSEPGRTTGGIGNLKGGQSSLLSTILRARHNKYEWKNLAIFQFSVDLDHKISELLQA